MAAGDPEPRDPREKRRPKDSEFYQIPPDLKQEFDLLMSERAASGAAVEKMGEALRTRRRLALASLVLGVLGGALIGVGPVLAIVLGLSARRIGKGQEGMPSGGLEMARFGILLGVVMLAVNVVTLYFLLRS